MKPQQPLRRGDGANVSHTPVHATSSAQASRAHDMHASSSKHTALGRRICDSSRTQPSSPQPKRRKMQSDHPISHGKNAQYACCPSFVNPGISQQQCINQTCTLDGSNTSLNSITFPCPTKTSPCDSARPIKLQNLSNIQNAQEDQVREERPTLLTDLPDDILTKIIHHALLMSPTRPAEISRRVKHRFHTTGRAIAMLSRRFNSLLRKSITSLEFGPKVSFRWLQAMLVFTKDSLQVLHLITESFDCGSDLCLMLASTAPPLRKLTITSLHAAPFEHVVAMFRALPNLKECEIQIPRPVDLAAIAHACHSLESLSLMPVHHYKEVDEIRRQIVSVIISPIGKRLRALKLPWCCSTMEAFQEIARHCVNLEHFSVEFGAMHWIRHRAYKSVEIEGIRIDLAEYANEQRTLFRSMLKAASKHQLQSFSLSTLDVIPSSDLDLIFKSLTGLKDIAINFGSAMNPPRCPEASFNLLQKSMSQSLNSIEVIGLRFTPEQVQQLANGFPKLTCVSVWMGRNERPSPEVFKTFGSRIKRLSLVCDWTEPMCRAVGDYNTNLESLFLIAKQLSLNSVRALLRGKGCILKEFSLIISRKGGPENGHLWNLGNGAQEVLASDRYETTVIVQDTARMVARDCSANLEKLNVSAASPSGQYIVDCTTIAKELRRKAPHLWQICGSFLKE